MPHRGKTNEPAFLRHTAEYCAGMLASARAPGEITTANANGFRGVSCRSDPYQKNPSLVEFLEEEGFQISQHLLGVRCRGDKT